MLLSFGFLGLTNTVTAVKNAQMAESPLLLIGGAAATLLKVTSFEDRISFLEKYTKIILILI